MACLVEDTVADLRAEHDAGVARAKRYLLWPLGGLTVIVGTLFRPIAFGDPLWAADHASGIPILVVCAILQPLREHIAALNQGLPQMVNEELRLDRVSIESGRYNQYLTFPDYTAHDLESDPGLDYVRDVYSEIFALSICEQLQTRPYGAKFHYELVDMNGAPVVSFTLAGADWAACQ